jgi:hypothetical protein
MDFRALFQLEIWWGSWQYMHEPGTGDRDVHRILADRLVLKPGGRNPPGFALGYPGSPPTISSALPMP